MVRNVCAAGTFALGLAVTGAAQAAEHTIVMTGLSYFPAVTYAAPGDTVVFYNDSGEEQTVVGKDVGWTVGPLTDQTEGTLVVEQATVLKFYSAYSDETCDANGVCKKNSEYGTYEAAEIKAEISFSSPY